MRKLPIAVLAAVLALVATAFAASRPQTIPLPTGWQPEGIAAHGSTLYSGSLADGAVLAVRTDGRGRHVVVPGAAGRSVAGLKVRGNRIFAAGAAGAKMYIFDRRDGDVLETIDPRTPGFVNDVTIRGAFAYFTNSDEPVLYRVRRSNGDLTKIALTGDLRYTQGFNANGIVSAGRRLITVQSNSGKLFTINPATGATRAITLRGLATDVKNGDGLLLKGRTLYVVENQDNRIAVVRLSRDLATGTVVRFLTDPDFDVPTTITRANGRLWAVNARFGIENPQSATFAIVRVNGSRR